MIALKGFGFPLARIAALLAGGLPDLAGFMALHEQLLRSEAARIERALALVATAQAMLARQGTLSPDDLMVLTRETSMNDDRIDQLAAAYRAAADRHLSPAEQAELATRGHDGMHRPDDHWAALNAEASRLMATGDPQSPEAMDLARLWMGKVFESTGGDPALTRKLKAVARDAHEHPAFLAAAPEANAVMDFVAQAYGAAIAAGIMPAPGAAD